MRFWTILSLGAPVLVVQREGNKSNLLLWILQNILRAMTVIQYNETDATGWLHVLKNPERDA